LRKSTFGVPKLADSCRRISQNSERPPRTVLDSGTHFRTPLVALLAGLAVALVLVSVAGGDGGPIPSAAGVYGACYRVKSGALRIVPASKGRRGPTAPPGRQGLQGQRDRPALTARPVPPGPLAQSVRSVRKVLTDRSACRVPRGLTVPRVPRVCRAHRALTGRSDRLAPWARKARWALLGATGRSGSKARLACPVRRDHRVVQGRKAPWGSRVLRERRALRARLVRRGLLDRVTPR
jgi:hypothetical protein